MSSSEKLKPLIFNSYEELKNRGCRIDRETLHSLKRMEITKCFKYFIEIEREARMKYQEGDEEEAYILYGRAMEIYRLLSDRMEDSFKRGKDGLIFYKISERMMLDLEQLSENLKSRFRQKSEVAGGTTTIDSPKERGDFADELYANSKEIVNFVERGKTALVLDYRDIQNKSIEYKGKRGSMDVVHIDRECIVLGSLLQSIIKALDISVRPLLETISHFDIVIFVGDLNDISREKGSKTKILYEALTSYNINNKLKRAPVIMERGFEGWENTYPYYVADRRDIPKFEMTFDEQFSTWIEESKQANKLRIQYPNLASTTLGYNKPETSYRMQQRKDKAEAPSDLYPSPASKNADNCEPIPTSSSFAIDKSTPSAPFTFIDEKREIPNKAKIPTIDRSKKPIDIRIQQPIYPSADKSDFSPAQQTFAEFCYNKENKAPTATMTKRSALPQVLGGARVADMPTETPTAASTAAAAPQQPPRPPTPDRSTKSNLLKSHQQQTEYFKALVMARSRLEEDSLSKQCKTKLGYTGLINMGNTCFMNATLQALFHTPGFSQLFRNPNMANLINTKNSLGTRGIISGCFSALLGLVWSGNFSAIRPYFFLHIFAQRVNSALADRQQHDAQEFQIYLLDALHEDTNKVDKRCPFEQNYNNSNLVESSKDFFERSRQFSSSPVNDIFNLTIISILQCKTCKATSVRFEGLNQLSVELPNHGKPTKLRDCLNAHFSTTLLDALWDCPTCKTRQSATRSTKIWSIPKILIIHMKRFSFDAGHFVKNEAEVSFDIDNFDISQYLHHKAPSCKANYSLYAITNHSGNLNSGHYTSFVKNLASNEMEWLHFDDERCSRWNTPSSSSKQAFLLYYQLCDDRLETGKGLM